MMRGALCKSLKHLLKRRLYGGPDEDSGGLGPDVLLRRHFDLPVRILCGERLICLFAAAAPGLLSAGNSGDGGFRSVVLTRHRRRGNDGFRRGFRIRGSILLRRDDRLLRYDRLGGLILTAGIRWLDRSFGLGRFVFRFLLRYTKLS